jgi:hypothetical protein
MTRRRDSTGLLTKPVECHPRTTRRSDEPQTGLMLVGDRPSQQGDDGNGTAICRIRAGQLFSVYGGAGAFLTGRIFLSSVDSILALNYQLAAPTVGRPYGVRRSERQIPAAHVRGAVFMDENDAVQDPFRFTVGIVHTADCSRRDEQDA